MFTEKDVNWNDLPTHLKRGSCCRKVQDIKSVQTKDGIVVDVERTRWFVDTEIPIFSQVPDYVNSKILFD